MKKVIIFVFALLFFVGVAQATNIPGVVDPKNGPEIWVTAVYNNSGGTLDAGDAVVWDIDSSTGDDDNYVTTTTTAATCNVAGVVWPVDIAASSTGIIAIRGPVSVDVLNSCQTVDGPVCTSTTAGSIISCTSTTSYGCMLGVVTGASDGTNAVVMLKNNL